MISLEAKRYARNFINDNCIARVPLGSKKLPAYNDPAKFYTWQFYTRAALLNPTVLNVVVSDFLDVYEDVIKRGTWQLCGVEAASTPLLTGIVIESARRGYNGAHAFTIRKDRKPYGLMNWIEGKVLMRPAMYIDDFTSDVHKTAIHAASILNDHNIRIADHGYSMICKDKLPRRDIKIGGTLVSMLSLFNLADFDLELADYEAAKTKGATWAA
jgi:hypothetical protein